jgi:hypothetical protein
MTTEVMLSPAAHLAPAKLYAPTPKAARGVLESFTAQVNNDHTRKAYLNAARPFAARCHERGIAQLADVQAFHVAAFLKDLQSDLAAGRQAIPGRAADAVRLAGDRQFDYCPGDVFSFRVAD